MSDGLRAALSDEIAALERDLETDQRYRRMVMLKAVLAAYSANGDTNTAGGTKRASSRRVSPATARIIDYLRSAIGSQLGPVPTRQLLVWLTDAGIPVPGSVPQNNVSAMLSHHSDFVSHGRLGWTLRKAGSDDAGEISGAAT